MTYTHTELIKQKLIDCGLCTDNEFLYLYVNLICENKSTQQQKHRTQKHHIVPKCYYKCNNIDIDNSKENTVNLLYKDHILAHYYLSLCSVDKYRYRLENAFLHLYNCTKPTDDIQENLEYYQKIYEDYVNNLSLNRVGKAAVNKGKVAIHKGATIKYIDKEQLLAYLENGWQRGTLPDTDEQKKAISKANSGICRTEEQRQHISMAKRGTKAWNKGKRLQPLSIDAKNKLSESVRKLKHIYKGNVCKRVSTELVNEYLEQGWILGRNDIASKINKTYKGIKVYCVETDKVYLSLRECEADTGVSRHIIRKMIQGEKVRTNNPINFHFVARYDGDEIELDNDLYAYRIN